MYEVVLDKIDVLVPFTVFEMTMLRYLKLVPRKLHLNAWAFLGAFHIAVEYMRVRPSVGLFFAIFKLTKSPKDPSVKQG